MFNILINIVDDPIDVDVLPPYSGATLAKGKVLIPLFTIFRSLLNIAHK